MRRHDARLASVVGVALVLVRWADHRCVSRLDRSLVNQRQAKAMTTHNHRRATQDARSGPPVPNATPGSPRGSLAGKIALSVRRGHGPRC